MRTATNPNTGEKVQFDDATGEWVPMAQEPQQAIPVDAAQSEVNLTGGGRGRLGWVGDTPELTQRLNTVEPADVAATGIVGGLLTMPAAGFGLAADVGLQAAAGAIPGFMEGGVEGAGVGGALGIAGGLVGRGIASAIDPIAEAMGKAEGMVKGILPASAPKEPNPILAQLREKSAKVITGGATSINKGARALGEDFATADELASIGFPLTPGEQLHNAAKVGTGEMGAAKNAITTEEKRMSGLLGGGLQNIKATQDAARTNWVAAKLGLEEGTALTDTNLANVYQQIGTQFDDAARSIGQVNVKDVIPDLEAIAENATASSKGQIDAIISDVKTLSGKNGGNLSGQDWQQVRTKIGRMQEAGAGQRDFGKIHDSGQVMDTLTRAMEDQLPQESAEALHELRKTYSFLSAVRKGKAVNPDGEVNATTLYNNWTKPQSNKFKGKDEIGRMLAAFRTYGSQRVPNSGTADRLMQAAQDFNVPGAGVVAAAKAALGR